MTKTNAASSTMLHQIEALESLLQKLQKAPNLHDKLKTLNAFAVVQSYLVHHPSLQGFASQATQIEQLAILSVLAIGQGNQIFENLDFSQIDKTLLSDLLQTIVDVERAYDSIGGIIGYHVTILKLIVAKNEPSIPLPATIRYTHPPGIELSKDTREVRSAVRWGIEALPRIAEIYPVGGAGDRLNLHDEYTDEALPAAVLSFCGKTLLENLVRDLQGREYLHYKLLGSQITTPISMMTSHEKNNHRNITQICEEHDWFGRPRDSIRFFIQPLVPIVTMSGEWVMQEPLKLLTKPGGHGVIWKLARDEGVLDWFLERGRRFALVRQINNPMAGTDNGLSAFAGFGTHHGKIFGFASCSRLLNTAEGMDVLIEKETSNGAEYSITNIEYTEFEKHGIKDVPENSGSPFSRFPANTNILFIDINTIKSVVERCPIPGMLINMKNKVKRCDADGKTEEVLAGRLESTMQNIADYIVDKYPHRLQHPKLSDFQTFVTYNDRRKTISVTKKSYVQGKPIRETPEGCYFELLQNYGDLLSTHCRVKLPALRSEEEYLKNGPGYICLYHPAMGPLYQVIAQKIRGGVFATNSELQLEIAEVDISELKLDGSLLIQADSIVGHKDTHGKICYSENTGKCTLHRVTVKNLGIDRTTPQQYWKNEMARHEVMRIVLHGNAEFVAKDVMFEGPLDIEVPAGHRMEAYMHDGTVEYRQEKIAAPTWFWSYSFDDDNRVILTLSNNNSP